MDPLILMIVVFLIYMLSSGIRNRNRDRRRMEENQSQNDRSGVPDHTLPQDEEEEPGSSLPSEKTAGQDEEYDYDAFRKKLRIAWHLPSEDSEEPVDAVPDQKSDAKRQSETIIQQTTPAEPTVLISQESAEADRKQRESDSVPVKEVQKWQQYAQKKADTTVIKKSAVTPSYHAANQKQWSEKDVEQWVQYEAVFGPPRCRSPWYPMPVPKRGAHRV